MVTDSGVTITPCLASVTLTVTVTAAALEKAVGESEDAAAWCDRITVSFAVSASFRARTVTVCAVFQLPPAPAVNIRSSVAALPLSPDSSASASWAAAGTDTVTVTLARGSRFSRTV